MIVISEHARKAMADDDITEAEILHCLEHGELGIKQIVKEEMRYGKKLETKEKTIVVIYMYTKEITKVITTYLIRRKKWQK